MTRVMPARKIPEAGNLLLQVSGCLPVLATGYLPLLSTFRFSSSFICLIVGSLAASPVVWSYYAAGDVPNLFRRDGKKSVSTDEADWRAPAFDAR